MSQIQVPGSVFYRESGRQAAMTPEVLDESQARRRRISLGTFDSRQEAVDALNSFHDQADQETFE
jgi:hypothetical protein